MLAIITQKLKKRSQVANPLSSKNLSWLKGDIMIDTTTKILTKKI